MELLKNTLQPFVRVNLSDLDKVKLMNRTDQKFCLHIRQLPVVLEAINSQYSILEIDNEIVFKYDNTYYDTPDNRMFIAHQNGKRNRYKVRVRKYVQTDINFLEIKLKNNKGRTIKERITRPTFDTDFSQREIEFIGQTSTLPAEQLQPKIRSFFNRFTLVDNNFTERVTIDLAPGFKNQEKEITLNNLVIIEVKQSKEAKPALITQVLKNNKVSRQGFSKYCIGRSLLEEKIKKNNFKPLLLKIGKEFNN